MTKIQRPDIIAIGASAGGVTAASQLIQLLPRNLPATVLLVVHRSPYLVNLLPEIVRANAKIRVEQAEEGGILRLGVCFIAPVDRHLTLTPSFRIHLSPDNLYRAHSVDTLFMSLARYTGPRTIGVILSGLLRDGSEGLKALKEAGGIALVQDPGEADYSDMPRNAIAHDGPIDTIGSVKELAEDIRIRLGCLRVPRA